MMSKPTRIGHVPSFNIGGLRSRLIGLMWLRLLLVVAFLGTTIWFQIDAVHNYLQRSLLLLYSVIIGTLILTVVYALLLNRVKNLRRFTYLQLTGDVLLITFTIYVTAGIGSIFSFLYFFSIISGSILLNRRGGLTVASMGSLSYGTLIDLEFYGLLPNISNSPSYEIGDIFYALYVHILAFFTVALLSGSLAEKIIEAEKKLEASKEDFRKLEDLNKSIIENISSGILTLDSDERITSFNRAAENLTGYTLKEVCYHKVKELFPDFNLMNEGAAREELSFEKKDRTKLSFGLSSSLLKDKDGKGIGHIIIFQDLTRLKDMEEELRRADRLKALGELAAGMAHEIRNPLASISGSIQVLRDNMGLNPDDRHLMDITLRETERLNTLITEFLVFAKPATKKERIDLKVIIEETLRLIDGQYEIKNIEVTKEIEGGMFIEADPKQIKQVFLNIFLNALQAMPDGGKLSIMSMFKPSRGQSTKPSTAEVTIVDTGPGIDQKDIDRIFDPFFTTREQGTGLGLAVVYRIVESHGGTIDVKSRKDNGTTFIIRLPICEQKELMYG